LEKLFPYNAFIVLALLSIHQVIRYLALKIHRNNQGHIQWLGGRKSIQPIKLSGVVLTCHHQGANVLLGPADATTTPIISASVKSRMVYLSSMVPAYSGCLVKKPLNDML